MNRELLFGKEEAIQSAIPHYKVDALLRKIDTDRYDDRENIRCNLVLTYDKLMAFVAKHLPDKFYMQGDQRISLRDKIFREIVANMLIHREYTNAYPSTFIIYKHKVETKNANRPHLYGQLLPETFVPFPKNPHIAQIFTQWDDLKNWVPDCEMYINIPKHTQEAKTFCLRKKTFLWLLSHWTMKQNPTKLS